MSRPTMLDPGAFAGWSRSRGVTLPYPVDLTGVDAAGVAGCDDHTSLDLLARVCASPRAAVFALVVDPSGSSDVCVAVAADREAVRLTVTSDRVTLVALRDSELVASAIDALPALSPLRLDATTVDEQAWNTALHRLATEPARVARGALETAALPPRLIDAMLAAVAEPVRIGLLGASAWDGPTARIGPTMASWFEYPAGATLATLLAPRHGTRRTVTVEGYDPDTARRSLLEAYGAAQRAVDPARRR